MTEPDCGCRVNVLVSAPGAAGYTVGVNDTTFHFCPLHKAAPDLLAALEGLIRSNFQHGMVKVTPGMFALIEQARAAIAKARLCAGTK